jgi:hypothetical protein
MGETFYLIEKITSPTHYANFASLICSVRRGIINISHNFSYNTNFATWLRHFVST